MADECSKAAEKSIKRPDTEEDISHFADFDEPGSISL